MMNSHLPSFGYPPNWQLQPCWQLQASMLSALTRKGVLPSFAFAGVFFTFVFAGIYHLRLKEIASDHIHPFCGSSIDRAGVPRAVIMLVRVSALIGSARHGTIRRVNER